MERSLRIPRAQDTPPRNAAQFNRAHADGDIRPWPGEAPTRKRRRAKRVTATLSAVRELRPARTEIIICTGLRTRGGIQVWGDIAMGLGMDRRQKG